MWGAISKQLSAALDRSTEIARRESVSGGCVHEAFRITTRDGSDFFVKADRDDRLPVFEAEARGLAELARTQSIRVPSPICHGSADDGKAFIVLEYVTMGPRGDDGERGRQLARLHRCAAAEFGWDSDNFIGGTLQPNVWSGSWIAFFGEYRLRHQFNLASSKGIPLRRTDLLLGRMEAFFGEYSPVPSLLHGDLWGGNAAFDASGAPVIFDPAVYYGDREADLAMTELFGGFSASFYSAYDAAWPRDSGYPTRRTLYNLYHILNHANLFGGGYGRQAQAMIDELLAKR